MVYSDVIKNDWHLLLPKKNKYTKADYKKLLKTLKELESKQVFFIVKCIAAYHDTQTSKFYNTLSNIILA